MSEEYIESVTPDFVNEPKNNTTKIIIIVAVVIVLCICICMCIFVFIPTLFSPIIGDVFSGVVDEMLLTPMP
ncbi:hypothetical protein ACFLXI_04595 [Chloroflexota bacterium]